MILNIIKRLCYSAKPVKFHRSFLSPDAKIVTFISRTPYTQNWGKIKKSEDLRVSCNKFFYEPGDKKLTRYFYVPSNNNLLKNNLICARNYSTASPEKKKHHQKKTVPRLILIQNPLTWLVTKFDLVVLRSVWDPAFEEKEFKLGTKQAISRVTTIVSEGRYADLSGLLTKSARAVLIKDLGRSWTQQQRKLMALTNEDIQITSPRKVYFMRMDDKKYCAVDMVFLALKWASPHRSDGLVFAEIFARFHREYTPHCIPEWTIAYFKLTRFDILRKKTT